MKYITILIVFTLVSGITACTRMENSNYRQELFGDEADSLVNSSKDYDAYPEGSRTRLLTETFADNRNNWPILEPISYPGQEYVAYIDSGYYIVGSNNATARQAFIDLDIDVQQNFEIEFSGKIPTHTQDVLYDRSSFAMGSGNSGYLIGQYQNRENDYCYVRRFNGDSVVSFPGTFSENGENSLITIRKIKNSLLLFVNKQYVGISPFEPNKITNIGFVFVLEYRIDFIRVDYLN